MQPQPAQNGSRPVQTSPCRQKPQQSFSTSAKVASDQDLHFWGLNDCEHKPLNNQSTQQTDDGHPRLTHKRKNLVPWMASINL